MIIDLTKYLELMVAKGASDLHLKVGAPPIVRKNQRLVLLFKNHPPFQSQNLSDIVNKVLTGHQQSILAENKQIDFGYSVSNLGRFRFNIFYQRGTLRLVARNIPFNIPSLKDLNLPTAFQNFVERHKNGLIIIAGSTGNGKSSSVAAMLDHINKTSSNHIMTIEDPIEFLIKDNKSIISQREFGSDFLDFQTALRATVRQDPDIIFVGELRDRATAELAINASNTGHLVITTLHTNNAVETVNRLLSLVDQESLQLTRMNIAGCLRAIVSQKLILKKDGTGLVPAVELLINNPRVRAVLEDPQKSLSALQEILEESRESWGMQSLNQHLLDLTAQNIISQEEALKASYSPEKLKMKFGGLHHNKNKEDLHFDAPATNNLEQLDIVEKMEYKKAD